MKRSPLVGPLVIVAAILWLALGPSLVGGRGLPAVLAGITGALGVGIGARITDLAWRRRPRPQQEPPAEGSPPARRRNYPRGRDLPGR